MFTATLPLLHATAPVASQRAAHVSVPVAKQDKMGQNKTRQDNSWTILASVAQSSQRPNCRGLGALRRWEPSAPGRRIVTGIRIQVANDAVGQNSAHYDSP